MEYYLLTANGKLSLYSNYDNLIRYVNGKIHEQFVEVRKHIIDIFEENPDISFNLNYDVLSKLDANRKYDLTYYSACFHSEFDDTEAMSLTVAEIENHGDINNFTVTMKLKDASAIDRVSFTVKHEYYDCNVILTVNMQQLLDVLHGNENTPLRDAIMLAKRYKRVNVTSFNYNVEKISVVDL